MNPQKKFFHIKPSLLPEKTTLFPFHLYLRLEEGGAYSLFLPANTPWDPEKRRILQAHMEKGAILAVSMGQKLTFLKETGLREEDIPDLAPNLTPPLIESLGIPPKIAKDFDLQKEISLALDNDNLTNMINWVRQEVLLFNLTVSPTVSLSKELCEKLLHEDNITNRIVVLAFLLAKFSKMTSEEELGALVCAAFMHNIGLNQMAIHYSRTPYLNLSKEEKIQYQEHVLLSKKFIEESGLQIGPRALRLILEHHERADGSGHPKGLKLEEIDDLSLILGAASHLVEYSFGTITGNKVGLKHVLQLIKNKIKRPGLETSFGDKVYNDIVDFLDYSENRIH